MSVFKKNFFSPVGLGLWAYVFSPDSDGKYADDKYKIKVRLSGEEAQRMIRLIESFIPEAAAEEGEEITGLPYEQALDRDKNPIEGSYDFSMKTKKAPVVIDAQKRRLTKGHLPDFKDGRILGDVAVSFRPYSWTIKNKRGSDSGIGLYLQTVQLVRAFGGVDLDGFESYDDGFSGSDTFEYSSSDGDGEDAPDFASM